MTINMTELDGKEKYYDLPNNLPVKTLPFDTIESGDLMLYDSNTRVVFTKHFPTPTRTQGSDALTTH